MSRDVDVSTFRAFLARISAQQFLKKVADAPFAVLRIQNPCTCGDPVGLVTPSARASERGDRPGPRGMGSLSHWAVPRSQDACVIVPELQILTACHTEAGKC